MEVTKGSIGYHQYLQACLNYHKEYEHFVRWERVTKAFNSLASFRELPAHNNQNVVTAIFEQKFNAVRENVKRMEIARLGM
jgi:hypothetical protein